MADQKLTLTLPEKVAARIEHLRSLDGSKDMTEVMRRALAVYDAALCFVVEDAGALIARDKDGHERAFDIIPHSD